MNFVTKIAVALRLPGPDREVILARYRTPLAAHYGVVQPEYVVVPDRLLANTAELKPYFDASITCVSSFKAKGKPGTKTKGTKPVRRGGKLRP